MARLVTDPAIARSLELQRCGYRVVVQQEKGEVTVYLGKVGAPIASDVKAMAGTFEGALAAAAARIPRRRRKEA
jgi:hypothetical protein